MCKNSINFWGRAEDNLKQNQTLIIQQNLANILDHRNSKTELIILSTSLVATKSLPSKPILLLIKPHLFVIGRSSPHGYPLKQSFALKLH